METARIFRVSTGTVLRWESEAQAKPDRETVGSLLKPDPPVRRFADVVRHVVQTLTLAGFPGDASVAASLARAGWRLSRRTVQRIRREKPVARPPSPPLPATKSHSVRARYPHHVWMFDITEIPGLLRLFSFKLAVVFDVFSRSPLVARVFLAEPSAVDIGRLFSTAVRRFGAPRHSVSDQGPQFTAEIFQEEPRPPRRPPPLRRHRQDRLHRPHRAVLPDPEVDRCVSGDTASPSRRSRAPGSLRPSSTTSGCDPIAGWGEPPRPSACSDSGPLTSTPSRLHVVGPAKPSRSSPPFELRYLGPDRRLPYLVRKAA